MKWTVQQLYSLRKKEIVFDETIDLDELKQIDKQIRNISPVHVSGTVSSTERLISFQLRIKGTLTLPCSRTLEDVLFPIDIESKENFTFEEFRFHYEEDEDIHLIEGNVVDLIPIVKEHILLAIPMQVYSDKAESNSLQLGNDWEFITEEKRKDRIDPRLAELAKFFDKQNESEKNE